MRLTPLITAAALLIVAFASVEARAGSLVVSNFNCSQTLPCTDSDPSFPTPDQLAAIGNSCMVQNTGLSPGNGFFDTMAGVDGSGCLTQAASGSLPSSSGAKCCIIKGGTGRCFLHCDMIVAQ